MPKILRPGSQCMHDVGLWTQAGPQHPILEVLPHSRLMGQTNRQCRLAHARKALSRKCQCFPRHQAVDHVSQQRLAPHEVRGHSWHADEERRLGGFLRGIHMDMLITADKIAATSIYPTFDVSAALSANSPRRLRILFAHRDDCLSWNAKLEPAYASTQSPAANSLRSGRTCRAPSPLNCKCPQCGASSRDKRL